MLLLAFVLAFQEPSPKALSWEAVVVDERGEHGPRVAKELTCLARILLDAADAAKTSGLAPRPPLQPANGPERLQPLLERWPALHASPEAIADEARQLGAGNAVVASVAARGPDLPVQITCFVVVSNEAAPRVASSVVATSEVEPALRPFHGALAEALGKARDVTFTHQEVLIAGLEAQLLAGEPLSAEGRARALVGSVPDPRLHRLIGASRALRGDLRGAAESLRAALKLSPDAAWMRLELADLLARDEREVEAALEYAEALKNLSGARAETARSALARLDEARRVERARTEAWNSARSFAEAALGQATRLRSERETLERDALARAEAKSAATPSDAGAQSALGRQLASSGRPERAKAVFRRALDLDANSVEARVALARLLSSEASPGQGEDGRIEAQRLLEDALRLAPNHAGATAALHDLLVATPSSPEPRFCDGTASPAAIDIAAYDLSQEVQAPRLAQALAAVESALAQEPESGPLLARAAELALRRGNLEAARGFIRRALDAESPDARRVQATLLRLRGKTDDARRQMALFLADSSLLAEQTAPEQLVPVVRELSALGLEREARAVIAKGTQAHPTHAVLVAEEARLDAHAKNLARACERFRSAIALSEATGHPPRLVLPLRIELAEAVLAQGSAREALSELDPVVEELEREEARLRGSRLERSDPERESEITRPQSQRLEPVDFGGSRERAQWAQVRLLTGKARSALGRRAKSHIDLAWAARCVAVEKGRVRPESTWPESLPRSGKRIAAEAVATLGLIALDGNERGRATACLALAHSIDATAVSVPLLGERLK